MRVSLLLVMTAKSSSIIGSSDFRNASILLQLKYIRCVCHRIAMPLMTSHDDITRRVELWHAMASPTGAELSAAIFLLGNFYILTITLFLTWVHVSANLLPSINILYVNLLHHEKALLLLLRYISLGDYVWLFLLGRDLAKSAN